MEIRPRRGIHESNNRNLRQFIAREQDYHINGQGDEVDVDDYNSEDEQVTFNSQQLLIEKENRYNNQRVRKSYPITTTDDNDDPGVDDNDDNYEYNNVTVVWDNNSSQSFQSSTHSSPNSSRNQKKTPPSPRTTSTNNKKILQNKNIKISPENNSSWTLFTILIVLLFLCGISLTLIFPHSQITELNTIEVPCDFEDLKQQFPRQDEFFWQSLQNGIEGVFKHLYPTKLTVFLLAYNNRSKSVAELLINKIVDRTIKCKRSSTDDAVRLNHFDFQTPDVEADYGVLLTKYKEPLFQRRIMVVKDFNKVPYKAARAFHTICDTETPWVRTSVIYLTMEIETNATRNDNSITIMEQIERHLESNWRDLNENTLAPLIARVTDQILLINS